MFATAITGPCSMNTLRDKYIFSKTSRRLLLLRNWLAWPRSGAARKLCQESIVLSLVPNGNKAWSRLGVSSKCHTAMIQLWRQSLRLARGTSFNGDMAKNDLKYRRVTCGTWLKVFANPWDHIFLSCLAGYTQMEYSPLRNNPWPNRTLGGYFTQNLES